MSRGGIRDPLARMIRPEIASRQVRHRAVALVIDRRATMRRAPGDYDRTQGRVLWRIVVEGDRPQPVSSGSQEYVGVLCDLTPSRA